MGIAPSRKGDVYTPTSAFVWTAPTDPALPAHDALSGPIVVLFWSYAFGLRNWDLQRPDLASYHEGVIGSTSCNRIWSGYCGLGTPQFPGRTADIDETDLNHSSQKVGKHDTQIPHGRTRPNDQTLETKLVRAAWNQCAVGQPLQADATLIIEVLFPFLLQQKVAVQVSRLRRWRLELDAFGWRRVLHATPRLLAEQGSSITSALPESLPTGTVPDAAIQPRRFTPNWSPTPNPHYCQELWEQNYLVQTRSAILGKLLKLGSCSKV